ncbi:peptidase M28 [Pedobacter yulinensis]|uniref:Carboxypeptidase Q n=1 Tax=Pedobacter yulinensis TaxID=2126353 RepID=A0A2T3HQF0_9SPHI|nr:M28 family peptidase [Pedobacter yulinensis]PST84623.1 peptidase M28 [Pedobacter yulinensis]
MKFRLILSGLLLPAVLLAQQPAARYLGLARAGFNEKNALQTTAYVEQRWRLPGNTGFNESIQHVAAQLEKAGYKLQTAGSPAASLSYRIERRPMNRATWEPVSALVRITGQKTSLLELRTNRNMLAINSAGTPPAGITAAVIQLKSAADMQHMDLKGKIVYLDKAPASFFAAAMKAGAAGVLGYAMPAYTQPEKHQTSIQFSRISNAEGKGFAINLSYAARQRLQAALAAGPVKLDVAIRTKTYLAEELTLIAEIRGGEKPEERFVYSAHVQEPGANDNATGVATLAEMARLAAQLHAGGKARPARTLTFLWGDEITSTRRYIADDSLRAAGIRWGMSLDMVGEDTRKTGGSFLIEKMPDPSAIWTRGADKHSEWGAGEIAEKDLFPHYFNDFILNICREQGRFANWKVNSNPFEGGSDHTPFLQARIPGLLMWHFTDVFYHTDNDRLDKVSPATMKNVGVCALAAGLTLCSADEQTAFLVLEQVKQAARIRLQDEAVLSKAAIAAGQDRNGQKKILQSWSTWYTGALASVGDLPVRKESTKLGSAIKVATLALEAQTNTLLQQL